MMSTYAINSKPDSNKHMKDFKEIYAQTNCGTTNLSPSTIYYMEIIDENPDNDETMRHLAELLLDSAISQHQDNYVVLVGDGKTYEHLIQIKHLYGPALQKLLIFPGDWHTLANFQPVLMKAHYDAGLKEIAMSSGFRGETLNSLEKCSHFKRTHTFLMQVWEALYLQMLNAYASTNSASLFTQSLHDLLNKQGEPSTEIMEQVEHLINQSGHYHKFLSFIKTCSEQDDTWKFWAKFVLEDCIAYIGLYLAIRCNNWSLRVASLKMMAPLFTAYDRVHYQKLIPHHLADLQNYPQKILKCFQSGAFAVSITGHKGHSTAFDETHEMCINRDMKAAIARPTKAYLQKTSLFLRYRIAAHKALLKQVYPLSGQIKEPEDTLLCKIKRSNENVSAMLKTIQEFNLLPPNTHTSSNRGLVNVFSGTVATPEQRHDLLNFRTIGFSQMIFYVKQRILKVPSTTAPVRQQRLLTFGTKQKSKKRLSHKEQEHKQITKCLRQRLAWCNRTGQGYDPTTEQYSIYPRAICNETGNLNKGTKASWTDKLRKRYDLANPPVVLDTLPKGWVPEAVIIDGMFLIQCAPLRQTATISRYAEMLFNRFVLSHFNDGAVEVHLIFDSPSVQLFSPKQTERTRRDNMHANTSNHEHICFTPSTKIPNSWRTLVECRTCKQSIIAAISLAYVQTANVKLAAHQKLVIAGSLPDTWEISGCKPPQIRPMYSTNAEEADMRIWRHVYQSKGTKILIYSPDTDVYNIGLPLNSITSHQDCIIQINLPHSREQKFVSLNNLQKALDNDPDLAGIPRETLANVFQVLFIVSGCDYVSFFAGLGKAAFMNAFYQYSTFITGGQEEGYLCDINGEKEIRKGFFSFIRLIGTLYFKKHLSAFVVLRNVQTPVQLYNSTTGETIDARHQQWYNEIRGIISDRICSEEERVPSYTSMWRHWLRSCWIAKMWQNSIAVDVYANLPNPEDSGWTKGNDGSYSIDWDSSELQTEVQQTIHFLTKGCTCKKGCKNKQCSCRKNGRECGPGCQCQGCTNLPTKASGYGVAEAEESESSDSDDSSSASTSSDEERYSTEVITDTDYLQGEVPDLTFCPPCSSQDTNYT